mgnify:CR=1 FL=1
MLKLRFKEGLVTSSWNKALAWRNTQCNFTSKRMGWKWQAFCAVCFSSACFKSWCCLIKRTSWHKTYGTSSMRKWHLPCERRTIFLMFWWDHSLSHNQRAWKRPLVIKSLRWNQDDHSRILNFILVRCHVRNEKITLSWTRQSWTWTKNLSSWRMKE